MAQVAGGEQGPYTVWDADAWAKERKDMTILYADLEEKVPLTQQPPAQPQTQAQAGPGMVGRGF